MQFTVTWEQLGLFLKIDKGHSQKAQSVHANKSRFSVIERWFADKEWNRNNFRLFLAQLQNEGKSQETLNKYISFGKYIDEYLGVEETKGFKTRVPKLPKIEATLTAAEIRSLAELKFPYKKWCEFLNLRQKALIMLLGLSGCRISEALGLKWQNLKEFPRRHLVFEDTKNGTDREVVIDDELWSLIQTVPRKNEYVFSSARQKNLESAEVNTDLKNRAAMLGIKKRVYCHLFRHSFATIMGELGLSDSDICQLIGWKDPKMMMRYKNSQLDYFAGLMQLHPLLQRKMSYQERGERLLKESRKWFDPSVHEMKLSTQEGKIVLEIISGPLQNVDDD